MPGIAGHTSVSSRFGEIAACLPVAVMVLDRDGRITQANLAAERILGLKRPLLIGRAFDDPRLFENRSWQMLTSAGEPLSREAHPFELVLRTLAPVQGFRMTIARASAEPLHVTVDAGPIFAEGGSLSGVTLTISDATDSTALRAERAWVLRELVRQRQRVEGLLRLSESLNRVNARLHSSLEPETIARRVAEEATGALSADLGIVELLERGVWAYGALGGAGEGGGEFPRAAGDLGLEGFIWSARRAVAIEDVTADARIDGDAARGLGIRSLAATPIFVRDELVGYVAVGYAESRAFGPGELNFLSSVGATASLSVENAVHYAEERHIASTLQRSLLTVPPKIEGVEFSHAHQSSTEAALVGGDFVDLFEIDETHVGILVGDVAGKGIGAAALASLVRELVKAHAHEGPSPAAVLARVNDLLYRVTDPGVFVTVLFGVAEFREGQDARWTYCNAGHPPAIVKRSREKPHLLLEVSPILGAWSGVPFRDGHAELGRSDTLVLYTDGVVEARRDREFFGEERWLELVGATSARPLGAMAQRLLAAVYEFTGGTLLDDIAILCARVGA